MPSPRAVLADIKKFRLDPSKSHSSIRANGHLAHSPNVETPSLTVVDEIPTFEVETVVVQLVEEIQPEWSHDLELTTTSVSDIIEEQPAQETEVSVVSEDASTIDDVVAQPDQVEIVSDVLHVEEQSTTSKKSKKKKIN